ncbi:Calx-beta domain-containing protein [Thalassoroseus pseudoceratinae]|uniref:Calx-beta domain-containing protein n=1 Tax=Thalassoroseus pseudoceratinae TaxID=2713176 RepID=UPI00141E3040|nr:Calx-beta domain-containing protein [Thalassoroseus pseudoceratinae]
MLLTHWLKHLLLRRNPFRAAQRKKRQRLSQGSIQVGTPSERLEDRLLLAATWRAGLTSNDDFVLDLENSGGTEFSVSSTGEVTIGAGGASNFVVDQNGNLTIAGIFADSSSVTLKENFTQVDGSVVLDQLADLPILRYNYIGDPESVTHLSPTAEEFYAAFQLGADAQHISPLDLTGTLLVGIQELSEIVDDQQAQIDSLLSHLGVVEPPDYRAAFATDSPFGEEWVWEDFLAYVGQGVETNSQPVAPTATFQFEQTSPGGPILATTESDSTGEAPIHNFSDILTVFSAAQNQLGGTTIVAPIEIINDDVLIQGSLVVGDDADTADAYGSDTLRLRDEVIRVHFQDTSISASFPTRDWRILVNDALIGGTSHFSVEDSDLGTTPFRLEAGGPGDAVVIDSSGQIGFGTADPTQTLHLVAGDSPTVRLEQDAADPSIWDFGGNESNFFVRDASGNLLPFRIRTGAPDGSLEIASDGNVGVGTSDPTSSLHIQSDDGTANLTVQETSTTDAMRDLVTLNNNGAGHIVLSNTDTNTTVRTGLAADNSYVINFTGATDPEFRLGEDGSLTLGATPTTFVLDAAGNLTLSGTLNATSSRTLKENFESVEADQILQQINDLDVLRWNYIADDDSIQHVGPLAEDFYAAFGLGEDPRHIASSDVAGIAVAGIQALLVQMEIQNDQIAYLSELAGVDYEPLIVFASPSLPSANSPSLSPQQNNGLPVFQLSVDEQTYSNPVAQSTISLLSQAVSSGGGTLTLAEMTGGGQVQIINDNFGTTFSLGIGDGSVNGMDFGFDTVRLTEDVLRVHFEDTSTGTHNPSNDWRFVINDAEPGGENHFSIVDAETGETLFRIDQGARDFSLVVDNGGNVGLGTENPDQAIHIANGDTPTVRLEQDETLGFASQVYDLGGNEQGFFLRDVTNNSTVPFRIRPGAPTSSLDIAANGNVGIGTSTPNSSVHVSRDDGTAQVAVEELSTTTADRDLLTLTNHGASQIAITNTDGSPVTWRTGISSTEGFTFDLANTTGSEFVINQDGSMTVGPDGAANLQLDANGDVTIAGSLNASSSRALKENFQAVNSLEVLNRLESLSLQRWNYIADSDDVEHFGPFAEDFYALFGLGADAQHLTPSDLASSGLVGLQGLLEIAEHHGTQLERISQQLGLTGWTSDVPSVDPFGGSDWTVALDGATTQQATGVGSPSSNSGDQASPAESATVTNNESTPQSQASSFVRYGSSMQVVDHLTDQDDGGDHGHGESYFLAETGTENYFVWQDQDASTADVIDIYYDFRDEGGFTNQISSEEIALAEQALASWETAADGNIRFQRNTSAAREDIINIGVGNLEAFGFTGGFGGTLAVGGGTVFNGTNPSITSGVVWLDTTETWDFEQDNGNPAGTYDSLTVLTHEIGHALGLGHTDDLAGVDIMDGIYTGEQTQFSNVDRQLVQILYGNVTTESLPESQGEVVLLPAQVFFGDLAIDGSLVVGTDAVSGETFGLDTLRLKENNLRIGFVDSSTDGGPSGDWQITINDSQNGGQSYFSIDEQSTPGGSTGDSKFRVLTGAGNDAFVVDQSGRIGLGTRNPVENLHIINGTSPAMRFGQDDSQLLTPFVWDIGGDDTSFYIRDVTSGDLLPFQIRPGAPTSSFDVASNGNVGIGTDTPASRFHILRSDGSAQLQVEETSSTTADRDLMVLTNNGGVFMSFTSEVSSSNVVTDDVQIGVAKDATVNGSEVTFDYYLENLDADELSRLSLTDDLDAVLGAGNYTITAAPVLIDDPGTISLNANFDGSGETQLIAQPTEGLESGRTLGDIALGSTLESGDTAQIRLVVNVHAIADFGFGLGMYENQATATAQGPEGVSTTDLSDNGTDPDPNGNGDPTEAGENDATTFTIPVNPVIGLSHDIEVFGQDFATIDVGGSNTFDFGSRVRMNYTLENLGNVALSNIDLANDLNAVFGAGNYGTINSGFPMVTVTGTGSISTNSVFNGSTQTQLITSGTLNPGESAVVTVELLVTSITDQGLGVGIFTNQATVSAEDQFSTFVTDLSHAGTDPDPNDNGDPTEAGENAPTDFIVGAAIGAAKDATVTDNHVTIDLYLENFGDDNFTNLSLVDDLDAAFGEGNYTITTSPFLVDDPGTITLNPAFDGSLDTQLLDPSSTLSATDTAQIQFVVTVDQVSNLGSGFGVYSNQAIAFATDRFGGVLTDLSHTGTDPDPGGDNDPSTFGSEDTPTSIVVVSDALVGVAKDVSVSGTEVTVDLYIENFGTQTSSNLSLVDDLDAVFGAGNYTILVDPMLIADPGTITLNGSYDGSSVTELLDSSSTLGAGVTAQIQFVVDVTNISDQGFGTGVYENQSIVTGTAPGGLVLSDTSDDGTDPDPTGDGDPTGFGENDPTRFGAGTAIIGLAVNSSVSGTVVTFDYTIENLGETAIENIVMEHPLNLVFGSGNFSVVQQPALVDGPATLLFSTQFFGFSIFDNLVVGGTLGAGESVTFRTQVNVTHVTDQGLGLGVYETSLIVDGSDVNGVAVSDISDAGFVSDANGNGDPTESGEHDPTPITIGEEAFIGIAKNATVNGTQVTFDYYLENFGNVDLSSLDLADDLDEVFGVDNYTISAAPSFLDDPTTITLNDDFDGSSDTALIQSGTLSIGDTAGIQVVVDVTNIVDRGLDRGFFENQVMISGTAPGGSVARDVSDSGTDPDPDMDGDASGDDESDPTQFVVGFSEIGLAKSASVDDDFVTFDFFIENLGTETLSNLSLTEDLDSLFGIGNYQLVNAPFFVGDSRDLFVNQDFDGSSDTQLIRSGTIDGRITAQIRVVVQLTDVIDAGSGLGVYSNQVMVTAQNPASVMLSDLSHTGTDPDPNGNGSPDDVGEFDATTFTVLVSDLQVTKTDSVEHVSPGESVTYTITYNNTGNATATGVTLTETLPAGTSFDASNSTSGWVESPANSGIYVLNIGDVAANDPAQNVTFALLIDDPVMAGITEFANSVSIAADSNGGFDFDLSNNTDTDTNILNASLSITADDASKNEGDSGTTEFTFTVTRDRNTNGVTTVNYDVITIGGLNASDFVGGTIPTGTITFADGDEEEEITIQVIGDAIVELDESLMVMLSSPSVGSEIVTGTASSTITNDDAATISIDDVAETETDTGTTMFTFTVTLDNEVDTGVSFDFKTTDNTATAADNDFTAITTTTRNFTSTTAGATETITVMVNGDEKVELDESFFVNLSSIVAGGRDVTFADSQGLGTIPNDDAATISIDDVTELETDGTTMFTFTVTLDAEVDTAVSFDFATADDSATTADNDYTGIPTTTRNFASVTAGATETITVSVVGDENVEADETFFLNLSSLSASGRNVTFADNQGLGTISNDDFATLTLATLNATQSEGTGGTATDFTFTVTLDNPVQGGLDVTYTTNDDTATVSGNDYIDNDGTLSFQGNQGEQQTVTVQVNHDATVEADELFNVALGAISNLGIGIDSGDVTVSGSPQNGTIQNDDTAMLTLAALNTTQNEGTGGSTTDFTFTVTLDKPVQGGLSVAYNTNDDTATVADNDYVDNDAILSFTGTASEQQTITVRVNNDAKVELDEQFDVALGAISDLGIGIDSRDVSVAGSPLDGTIRNDDSATISIDDVTLSEGDPGTAAFTFTVTLDAEVDTSVSFDFETTNGTATTADNDYTSVTTTTRNFANVTAGSTETITVQVNGDQIVERNETFFLDLSSISAGGRDVTFTDSQGLGIITNDDASVLSINDVTILERNNGTSQAVFTVALDHAVDSAVTVNFTTTDGTATADTDYVASSGTLNFTGDAGEMQTILVDINGDHASEPDETFTVNVSNLSADGRNVSLPSPGTGTIQNDDLRPNQADFTTDAIPTANISGRFTELVSGNFDATPVTSTDDVFFWDPITGVNLILFGDNARTQQNNAIDATLINGNDFTQVLVGNFDAGGGTDLFFWNPLTGRNRLVHFNGGTGVVTSTFETNVVSAVQINGNDFTKAVVGNFDGTGASDMFFWNPQTGRNRTIAITTVTAGTDSDMGSVQNNAIDPMQINGNDFTEVVVGQFETGGLDELLFANLNNGNSRRISLTAPGGNTTVDMIRDGNVSLLNGSIFQTIAVADLNGDGLDDIFAWDPKSGQNRSILTAPDPDVEPAFVENAFAAKGINGDYEKVVRLVEDVFSNTSQDDLFLWNPTTGDNRIGSL